MGRMKGSVTGDRAVLPLHRGESWLLLWPMPKKRRATLMDIGGLDTGILFLLRYFTTLFGWVIALFREN